jgi:hypothetical protein
MNLRAANLRPGNGHGCLSESQAAIIGWHLPVNVHLETFFLQTRQGSLEQ